ncbi:MAG: hypothetical protein ABIC40_05425, partial [bacterium]
MLRKLFIISIISLIIGGCSVSKNPVLPGSDNTNGLKDANRIEMSESGTRMLWGMWEWVIDPVAETIDIVPLRSAEIHVNVNKFVDSVPSKIGISNFVVDAPNNQISLDVSLTHPFPGKPNFSGFDVRGIIIGSGTIANFSDPELRMAGLEDMHIINADGITRWWNPVDFNIGKNIFSYRDGALGVKYLKGLYNCTLNGFKLFSDDLGKNEAVENLSVTDRAVFAAGSTNTRHYDLFFPTNPLPPGGLLIKFNYAVD